MSAKEKLLLNGQNRSLKRLFRKKSSTKRTISHTTWAFKNGNKKYLVKEMQEIDKLVEKVIG